MQYISAVSKSSTEIDRVKKQLLESNPLLEGLKQRLHQQCKLTFLFTTEKHLEMQRHFVTTIRVDSERLTHYI